MFRKHRFSRSIFDDCIKLVWIQAVQQSTNTSHVKGGGEGGRYFPCFMAILLLHDNKLHKLARIVTFE